MRYISIDIETSGLDHQLNNILSMGAIIEDTEKKLPFDECPKFNCIVIQREICGSPRALTMNKDLLSILGDYIESDNDTKKKLIETSGYKFLEKEEVAKEFYWFLEENGLGYGFDAYAEVKDGKAHNMIHGGTKPITINVAGKNFGTFDKRFLQELPWWQKLIKTRQRILDPAILCVDWKNDEALPSLTQCKERTNIEGHVTHNALDDAWDVIEILRKFY